MADEELRAIKEDIESLRSDLKGLVRSVRSDGRNRLEGARARLLEVTHDLEERARKQLAAARDTVREHSEKALSSGREKISERPFIFVLGAFLAGLVLGKLLRRGK